MVNEEILAALPPDLREAYENAERPEMSDDFKERLKKRMDAEHPEEKFSKTKHQ